MEERALLSATFIATPQVRPAAIAFPTTRGVGLPRAGLLAQDWGGRSPVGSVAEAGPARIQSGGASALRIWAGLDPASRARRGLDDLAANVAVETKPEARRSEEVRGQGLEVVIIDPRVPAYDQLLEDLGAGADAPTFRVLVLDAGRDGVAQVAEFLRDLRDVETVRLIAHGREGGMLLGNAWLDAGSLGRAEVATWAESLAVGARWLLYGCDVAAGEEGRAYVRALAAATRAEVAASEDATGDAGSGGNWTLEFSTGGLGIVDAMPPGLSARWTGSLGIVTVTTTADVVDGLVTSIAALRAFPGLDGKISLREAIIATNNTPGADTILLTATLYRLTAPGLSEDLGLLGDLDIRDTLTIQGLPGVRSIIDAGGLTLAPDRAFDIHPGAVVTLRSLTIRGGSTSGGGGIYVRSGGSISIYDSVLAGNAANSGGGVLNDGTFAAFSSTFTGNSANNSGAIDNNGTLTLTDVAMTDNVANNAGGALRNSGGATLERVTISGNSASQGGGISNSGGSAVMTLTNVTISGNSAIHRGGGIYTTRPIDATNVTIAFNQATSPSSGSGGGVHAQGGNGDLRMRNTILYHNSAPIEPNANRELTTLGHNISDGIAIPSPAEGDQVDVDPMIDPLADNGGYSWTHALRAGSPAIDQGTAAGAPPTDQRRYARLGATDIGAYEADAPSSNSPPIITSNGGGPTTLITIPENLTYVTTVTAIDTDLPPQALSYSIAGGADAALFYIDGDTGVLRFLLPPDYESPADVGRDNVYDVTVRVDDGAGGFTIQAITVVVADVPEEMVLVVDTTLDVVDGVVSSIGALLANRGADGRVSLREAILAANATPGQVTIRFQIPDDDPNRFYYQDDGVAGTLSDPVRTTLADSAITDFDPDYPFAAHGWFRIDLDPSWPELLITDAVILDGYSQPGARVNGLSLGTDAVILVELTSTAAGASTPPGLNSGIVVAAGGAGSTIRGLAINRFGSSGIVLEAGADATTIEGNFLGTDVTGTIALGNGDDGIQIRSGQNVIGGPTPASRNILSGNRNGGLSIFASSGAADGNLVQNNYFGVDATGTRALGNDSHGLVGDRLTNSSILDNVISANAGAGLWLRSPSSTGNTIQGNRIGTDATGVLGLGNGGAGIRISDGAGGARIGGTAAGEGNVIAFNAEPGVDVSSGTGTAILGNAILGNAGPGIDLRGDGPTPNDGLKSAGQPNLLMDSPVFTSASRAGASIELAGFVGSDGPAAAFGNARIDVYASDGTGQGARYLGTLTADADGSFRGAIPTGMLAVGDRITATATDASSNTSEFSATVAITRAAGELTLSGAASSIYGQSITLIATASGPGEMATGLVTFRDGTTVLAIVPLIDGVASFATPSLSAGAHEFTAHYDGDDFNLPASSDSLHHVITPATLTIVAEGATTTYGAPLPALTYRVSGLVGADTEGVLAGALATDAGPGAGAGTYAIGRGTLDAGPNYDIAFTPASLEVRPATLTVLAEGATRAFGQPNPPFTARFEGLVNGDTPGSLDGVLRFVTSAVAGSPVGGYEIEPDGLSSPNYRVQYVNGLLRVEPPVLQAWGASPAAIEGVAFRLPIAWFQAPDQSPRPDLYSAIIRWGDGEATRATIGFDTVRGAYEILGTHAYRVPGSYLIQVEVHAGGVVAATARGIADVSPTPLAMAGEGFERKLGEAFAGVLASFRDPNPGTGDLAYDVTIEWGDGTATAGTIEAVGVGEFRIYGSHLYRSPGSFTVHLSVVDVDGSAGELTVEGRVAAPPPSTSGHDPAGTPVASLPIASAPTFSGPAWPSGPSFVGHRAAGIDEPAHATTTALQPTLTTSQPVLFGSEGPQTEAEAAPSPPGGRRGGEADRASSDGDAPTAGIIQAAVELFLESLAPRIEAAVRGLMGMPEVRQSLPLQEDAPRQARLEELAPPHEDLWSRLDRLGDDLEEHEAGRRLVEVLGTGLVASAGFVFLNGRIGYGVLSALAARPLWDQVDFAAVLKDWERERDRRRKSGASDDDESLLDLVEGTPRSGDDEGNDAHASAQPGARELDRQPHLRRARPRALPRQRGRRASGATDPV